MTTEVWDGPVSDWLGPQTDYRMACTLAQTEGVRRHWGLRCAGPELFRNWYEGAAWVSAHRGRGFAPSRVGFCDDADPRECAENRRRGRCVREERSRG